MKMRIEVLRPKGTTYHLHAFGVPPVKMNYDYSKDFRDRLRRAQMWNRGNSIIYSLR